MNKPPAPQAANIPEPEKGSRLPAALSSFRHRNFRLWFSGQLVSMIGTWMQIIAQGWLVYQISQSELVLGIYGFAAAIPVLVVSPWAGVMADRIPRRSLLLATQICLHAERLHPGGANAAQRRPGVAYHSPRGGAGGDQRL